MYRDEFEESLAADEADTLAGRRAPRRLKRTRYKRTTTRTVAPVSTVPVVDEATRLKRREAARRGSKLFQLMRRATQIETQIAEAEYQKAVAESQIPIQEANLEVLLVKHAQERAVAKKRIAAFNAKLASYG
jgi:hypothetical protein